MAIRFLPSLLPQAYSQVSPQAIPQNFPQRAARWLVLSAALAALAACSTEPPAPARPQAIPLPDLERPVTSPGATPRQRIVEIALQEWRRWGGQTVRLGRDDTACVIATPLPAPVIASPASGEGQEEAASADSEAENSRPDEDCPNFPDGTGVEATAQGCTMAQRYWGIVGKQPSCEQVTQPNWAWSAVFISWVLRKAGLDDSQFLTGASHSMYVTDARDHVLPRPAFHVEAVPAMPRPGDLICAARGRDKYLGSPAEIGFGTTPMHCDIVVEVDPAAGLVKAIGGNVQQSVSMELVELGDSGQLDGVTNSHMPWLLVMRNDLR